MDLRHHQPPTRQREPAPLRAPMKAVASTSFGGPSVTKLITLPRPSPGRGQVLVRIAAAGISTIDLEHRSGALRAAFPRRTPLVPAAEASGTITSIGAGVENLKPGDAVMLFLGPDAGSGGGVVESAGALAEYVTVDAAHVALAPKKLYLPDAAGIPLAGLTGLQALDTLDVQEGERVLVSGAMSALGLVLVQLAKHRGAEVYAAVESAREEKDAEVQHALFTALGATVVDTPLAAWAAEHGKFDKAVDVAGKPDIFGALNPAAHVIAVGSPAATVADSAAGTGAGLKRMGTHLPWSRSMAAHARSAQVRYEHHLGRPDAAQLSKLAELVDKGELHVVMDSTFEVADFALAFLRLESGLAKGRVLVEFTRL